MNAHELIGQPIANFAHYQINRDYMIVRTPDGAVWEVEVNICGLIYEAVRIIPPLP
jgi:hypothetical protein